MREGRGRAVRLSWGGCRPRGALHRRRLRRRRPRRPVAAGVRGDRRAAALLREGETQRALRRESPHGVLLPDGDVLAAVTRERLAPPAAPALAQRHPGELRHQVELGRPHVPERHRRGSTRPSTSSKWCEIEPLVRDVVLVDAPVRLARVEDADGLAGREPPELGHPDLDHEAAAGLEVRGDVPEARDLRRLRRQIPDRVEDEVREARTSRRRWSSRSRRSSRRSSSPPGFARSLATIARDRSIPCTGTPRCASGSAIRPVPIPSSSARPLPASPARKSTTVDDGRVEHSAADSSYLAATRSSK